MTSTKDTANENCFGFVWGFAQASEAYVATINISNIYNSGNYTVNAPQAVGGMLLGRVHLYGTLNATNVYDAGVHSITTTSTDSAPLFGWGSGGELNKNLVNCYALQPVVNGDVNKNVSTNKSVSKATVYGPDGSTTATTTVYAWNGAAAQMPIHANSTLVASASTDIYLANATGTAYAKTSTIAAEGAAILNAVKTALYAPDISTASGNLEVRLKLTDDFGLMAITEADGFYFSTDANVKNGTKVAGQAYNGTGKVYSVYDQITAATLDTPVYFAAYVTVDGVDYLSEVRTLNPYTMAKDLADGYYGAAGTGVLVTENTHEMALYTEMANYCDAYKAYMDAIA
jgi:hypothetical protein